jgi:hypothetical protein
MEAVKVMARAGALSKAVKRVAAEVDRYEGDDVLQWAERLIPDVAATHEVCGARPVSGTERAELNGIATCADEIAPRAKSDDSDGDDDAAEGGAAHWKNLGGRAPTAFAEGVRFGPLSAPGPSGLRPEHLKAFARCRRARSRHDYEAAMRGFVAAAVRGRLPASCWWITDTAVTMVRKKGALPDAAPRPIRVGETLKRFVAKRIATAERAGLQRLFARRRQYGVACPGGVEILLHHRLVTCAGGGAEDVGEWDLDIKNCYGSLYWAAIDSSVRRHVPGALPWTRWMHSAAVRVILPGGRVHQTRRGAEQGDPLGAMYAAAVIVDVCAEAEKMSAAARRELLGQRPTAQRMGEAVLRMLSTAAERARDDPIGHATFTDAGHRFMHAAQGVADGCAMWDQGMAASRPVDERGEGQMMDVWYVDDAFVRGNVVDTDLWLAAWDAVAALTGMQRSMEKSFYKPLAAGTPTPPYTSLTCRQRAADDAGVYLGVQLGGQDGQYQQRVRDAARIHTLLRDLEDPALELLLIRHCADAGLVAFLLRAVGPSGDNGATGISQPVIDEFDAVMAAAVAQVTRSDVSAEAAQQAGWGVKAGGLGLRPASAVALPAHAASLVEARPFVEQLANEMRRRGVGAAGQMADVEAAAIERLTTGREDSLAAELMEAVDHARDRAERLAADVLGLPEASPAAGSGRRRDAPSGGDGDEAATGGGGRRRARLQHELSAAIDAAELHGVLRDLGQQRTAAAAIRSRRLADLGNANTVHSWLWAVNPAHGYVLHPDDYQTALRLRLGVDVADYPGVEPCGECATLVSASDFGRHALLCAKGRRTTAHNRIRDHLAQLASVSDAAVQTEAQWATACSGGADPPLDARRPADILTSAAPLGGVGSVALDVGVTTPFTEDALKRADVDVLDQYHSRKVAKYREAAAAARWQYRPVIVSAFGRAHAEAKKVVHRLSLAAAKKFGEPNASRIEGGWWRNCGTLLMERACRMVDRCRPTVRLPAAFGGVDEDRAGDRWPKRRAADGAPWVGCDGPAVPAGD